MQRGNKLTEEQVQKLKSVLNGYGNGKKVAKETGLSYVTIHKVLNGGSASASTIEKLEKVLQN